MKPTNMQPEKQPKKLEKKKQIKKEMRNLTTKKNKREKNRAATAESSLLVCYKNQSAAARGFSEIGESRSKNPTFLLFLYQLNILSLPVVPSLPQIMRAY